MALTGRSVPIITASTGGHPGLPIADGDHAGVFGFLQTVAGLPPLTGIHVFAAPSPFGNVPAGAVTILTDAGRTALNRQPVQPFRLNNWAFAAGTGGYDPADPTQATVPNPLAVALSSQVFPAAPGTYEPVDRIERPNANAISFLCRLEAGECLFAVGELGLFGQIVESPVPAEIGTWIMFALMHFPMQAKSDKTVQGYRFSLQF